ncbi:molecular chaperone [Qipengyuania sp. MTN3-11]|uniref:molecular chaperone n=1 Tax=Qipengyuania sp. MTN3-11 TaxID=3056557 RepID=UPI0036F26235
MTQKSIWFHIVLWLAVFGLAPVPADAMRVSPMVAELSTTGVGSAARIEVGNIGSAPLPFETRITELSVGPDGEFVETPADDNFLIFPPQGVVPVNGRQVVRVQWVGEGQIDTSKAYYLWVRQLPVSTNVEGPAEEGTASVSVQVLYTMKALIVVAPEGARPDVQVVSARVVEIAAPEPEIDPDLAAEEAAAPVPVVPTPGVEVIVRNDGNRYALMSGATWIIEGTGLDGQPLTQTLTSGDVAASVGVGYLAPDGTRTFEIPATTPFDPARPVKVRFAR